jgi:hypothetical protein
MITFYHTKIHITWSIFLSQLIFARVNGLKFFHETFNAATKLESNRNSALSSLSSNDYEVHNCSRSLIEVSFSYPSGLLINSAENTNFCLLQHNVVNLTPSYRRVLQCEDALSPNTCAQIIRDAEICACRDDGWTANRHSAYPTTDLPLEAIFGKFSAIHGLVNGNILPQMASFFGLIEDHLRIGELFVAKYEYGENKQAGLGISNKYCIVRPASLIEMHRFIFLLSSSLINYRDICVSDTD